MSDIQLFSVYHLPLEIDADQYKWLTMEDFHPSRSSQPLTFDAAKILFPIAERETYIIWLFYFSLQVQREFFISNVCKIRREM